MSEGSGIRQKVSALKQLELEERGEQSTALPSSVPGDRSEEGLRWTVNTKRTARSACRQHLQSRQCTGRMSAGQQPANFRNRKWHGSFS